MPRHRAGNGVVEGGPPAPALKLLLGGVEGCFAAGAGVDALLRGVLVVFAGEGGFGALFAEDAELFCNRRTPVSTTYLCMYETEV